MLINTLITSMKLQRINFLNLVQQPIWILRRKNGLEVDTKIKGSFPYTSSLSLKFTNPLSMFVLTEIGGITKKEEEPM